MQLGAGPSSGNHSASALGAVHIMFFLFLLHLFLHQNVIFTATGNSNDSEDAVGRAVPAVVAGFS